MSEKASLTIDIWTDGTLPDDLPEAFERHVEHVAKLVAKGYVEGEIREEGQFNGWWKIERKD